MALKSRLVSPDASLPPVPFCGSDCHCLANFFREEFIKHHRCLERQREYYSERAIEDAERALSRILAELERLSQRADAEEVLGRLLRKFDLVTNLSGWTEPDTLH